MLLNDPIKLQEKQKSMPSLNLTELQALRNNELFTSEQRKEYDIEYHKRSALSAACIIFSILGLAFGIITNRRSSKSSGFILSIGFIILYWIIYISFESLVRSNHLTTWVGLWFTNLIFIVLGLHQLKKVSK